MACYINIIIIIIIITLKFEIMKKILNLSWEFQHINRHQRYLFIKCQFNLACNNCLA